MIRRILMVLGFAGFIVSLIVHGATFFAPAWVADNSWVFVLHAGVFVVFGPAVYAARKAGESPLSFDKSDVFNVASISMIAVFFLYALVNFGLMFVNLEGGSPHDDHGSYSLLQHGRLIRTLDKREYDQMRAYEVRGFSGHWMLFYLAAAGMHARRRDQSRSSRT